MAAKKDFSKINTGRIYDTLAEATADPEQAQAKTRKDRKTYTGQEAMELIQNGQTAGRKGLKMPRINLAFSPDVYEYIKTMAQVRGETLTDFVNHILRQSMTDNAEIYKKAIEFKNSL